MSDANLYTFENPEFKKTYWHTCSHVLAQAMKRLHPEVKLAIGPAIENGFYYDFDTPEPFSETQLAELEAEMRKICKEKLKLERFELPRAEAIQFMEEKGEPYKVELIHDLPEDATISFYKQGEFTDLCAGPHLDSTGRIKGNAIKLTACNAAYWRGDSNRQTLQRIYGIAFPKKDELDEYLARIEEAKKRDLPIRMAELGLVHRHEMSGALHGLFRVRCFTQDDAHIFMTPGQMKEEIKGVVRIFDEIYSTFGLTYQIELSTMPEDHMGEEKVWQFAEETLQAAIQEMGKDFILNPGDGAFYGPKLDFHLADSLGRTWQCGTIQLDFQMPERFELEYVGEDGEKHRPVMIHRALLGSIERFIGVITEHFAGAFPTWLSPVQVKVLPITDRAAAYADQVAAQLDQAGYRVEVDHRNEKIGKKIREAQLEKIPYMLVVGDKEAESGQVAVRARSKGDLGAMDFAAFLAHLKQVVDEKQMDQAL